MHKNSILFKISQFPLVFIWLDNKKEFKIIALLDLFSVILEKKGLYSSMWDKQKDLN